MYIAIAFTLLFASLTSALGVFANYTHFLKRGFQRYLATAIFSAAMALWFCFAGIWVLLNH